MEESCSPSDVTICELDTNRKCAVRDEAARKGTARKCAARDEAARKGTDRKNIAKVFKKIPQRSISYEGPFKRAGQLPNIIPEASG